MNPNGMIQYMIHFKDKPVTTVYADTYAISDTWFVFFRQYATKDLGLVSHATHSFAHKDVDHIEAVFPEAQKAQTPKLDLVTN